MHEYFSNTRADAWGPGTRGTGLEPSISLGKGIFDSLSACVGGAHDGKPCEAPADCAAGGGACVAFDLSGSYRSPPPPPTPFSY